MTGCLEFRRQAGAEPARSGPEFDAHRRECPACARYQDELRAMDALMRRALAVDAARLALPKPRAAGSGDGRQRWYALAASVVMAVAAGLVLLTSAPRESVAREVLDHVAHEPGALTASQPVAPAALAGVLDPDGTRLRPGIGDVSFAARCVHQGHVVPHLVLRRPEGAVTVLILRHRTVDGPLRFEENGFAGVVLPAPRGSIAVVGRDHPDLEGVARQVFEAVDWGDTIPAAG
ncbi:MAG TPA: DUF3379 family protein [Steroidobacteraceae bacterium]|nr:DUF3379 family protein [Steroidobacteraceae bacterium]